ncbi:TRAP transporter small permease [Roseospira visakhapatnamensis]|uniref:TRAP transporter small permease protein n=1 Tax=Roseospira visakhapatnamensis TaxID=390880 RepID=A0A7W6RDJ6_9PROT|nr:TRAP transporter small permease [Roseospira visakhapatnamensis]MBB4266606.1 TRAP-type C4-dicarboxylate transport system permease small subunit [Roseospira visakhapatnamensis]
MQVYRPRDHGAWSTGDVIWQEIMEAEHVVTPPVSETVGRPPPPAPSIGPMRHLHRLIEWLAILMFTAIVVVAVIQVVNRFFLGNSLSWSEEFQRYGHIWLVLMSISIAYRRGAHIGVDLLHSLLPHRPATLLRGVIDVAWLLLGVLLIVSAWKILGVSARQISAGLGVTMDKVYAGFLFGGGYMILSAAEQLILRLLGRVRP